MQVRKLLALVAPLAAALCVLAAGCAQTGPLLESVVISDAERVHHDSPPRELPATVSVTRDGRRLAPALPLALQTGDEIDVGADATILIRFPEGHEVYVLPRSRVRVGSLFAYFGEILVRAKGLFRIDTEFVTAGVEGTEFWVRLEQDQDAAFGVMEGRVRLSSKSGDWPAVLVKENDVYSLHGGERPRFEKDRTASEFRRKLQVIQRLMMLPPRLPPRRQPGGGGGGY